MAEPHGDLGEGEASRADAAHLEMEDRAASGGRGGKRGGKSGGKGAGGRGGGKGGGGGKPQNRNVLLSKALSKLLRHQAGNAGVKLDEAGWAELDKVLAYGPIRSLQATLDDVRTVIADSDKTRFAIKPNPRTNPDPDPDPDPDLGESSSSSSTDPSHYLIRANQGHSIKLDSAALLKPIALSGGRIAEEGGAGADLATKGDDAESNPASASASVPVPAAVVHGTYLAHWPAIESSGGLRRMNRNHVHFATALPDDTRKEVSGMRRDAEVLVYVDVEASLRDGGLGWWVSENGVVLTEGDGAGFVPCRYFREVVVRKGLVPGATEDLVLWKDGEKVGDVPEGAKGRAPPQSRRGGRGGGGGVAGRDRGGRGGKGARGRGGGGAAAE